LERKGLRRIDTDLVHLRLVIPLIKDEHQVHSSIRLHSTSNILVGNFWNALDNDLIPGELEFVVFIWLVLFFSVKEGEKSTIYQEVAFWETAVATTISPQPCH
jgi:hypothetical protein